MVLFYNCGRGVLHARAVASLESRMYEGAVPLRVAAMPDPVNPLKWRGIVETPGAYVIQDLNLATDPGNARGTIFHKPDPEPAIDAARRTATFQAFLRFSQYPLWRVTPYAAWKTANSSRSSTCASARRWRPDSWRARWWIRTCKWWNPPSSSV